MTRAKRLDDESRGSRSDGKAMRARDDQSRTPRHCEPCVTGICARCGSNATRYAENAHSHATRDARARRQEDARGAPPYERLLAPSVGSPLLPVRPTRRPPAPCPHALPRLPVPPHPSPLPLLPLPPSLTGSHTARHPPALPRCPLQVCFASPTCRGRSNGQVRIVSSFATCGTATDADVERLAACPSTKERGNPRRAHRPQLPRSPAAVERHHPSPPTGHTTTTLSPSVPPPTCPPLPTPHAAPRLTARHRCRFRASCLGPPSVPPPTPNISGPCRKRAAPAPTRSRRSGRPPGSPAFATRAVIHPARPEAP